jgi:regulator of replication initiation timing
MPTKEELQQQIFDLEEALKVSGAELNQLENDADYHIEENNKLENRVEKLKYDLEVATEELEKLQDLNIKELKTMLCDRYALNHLTNWETLICKLETEAGCV